MYLLAVLSPIGAPIVGMLISTICSVDPVAQPDGPFAIGLSYCGISPVVEHLYQQSIMLSFMPALFAGPLIGWLMTTAWWCLGISAAIACIWHLWRSITGPIIERI